MPVQNLLRYLQNSTAISAHLAAHFCPALVCPQKSHRENSISSIFLESPHQVDMKKCCQILQTLFLVFQYSRKSQWIARKNRIRFQSFITITFSVILKIDQIYQLKAAYCIDAFQYHFYNELIFPIATFCKHN